MLLCVTLTIFGHSYTIFATMRPIDYLKQLQIEHNRQKYPNFPDNYRPVTKYKTTTANGLTRAITDFLNYSGHWASRINSQGTWVKEKAHVNGGYYRPSTQQKGIADIDSLINGKKVAIEVKVGKDRQSEAQKTFQERIERAGGHYWLVRDFDQFYNLYTQFIKN